MTRRCRLLRLGVLGVVFLLSPLSAASQTRGSARDLALRAEVTPNPAPLGANLSFRFTITNNGNRQAAVPTTGCPVHFRLDGVYSPRVRCPDITSRIYLDPGESLTFGPDDHPYLEFDPALYPLGPGRHRVVMAVESLGGAAAEFRVLPPSDLAFVGGRVIGGDGRPAASGFVNVHPVLPGPADPAEETLRVPLGPEGTFLLKALPPGPYTLEVVTEAGTLWYPGPEGTPPLELAAKEYRNLELAFPGKRNLFSLDGMVFEAPENGESVPLEGATVMAVPEPWPASSGVVSRTAGDGPVFAVRTREDGTFQLELPAGTYRLLAGKLGEYRYRYWNGSETVRGEEVTLPGGLPGKPIRFDLTPIRNAPLSVIEGRVFAESPSPEKNPAPLAGAAVVAYPVLPSEIAAAPQRIRTGPGGTFRMEVPADTPYRIQAEAPGFTPRFHPGSTDSEEAEWIETRPGARFSDLTFFLSRNGSRNRGALEGAVYRRLSTEDCGGGSNCLVPAAGARVRVVPAEAVFGPLVHLARTDADGRFRVEGLRANRHYFVAAADEDMEEVYAPGGVSFALAGAALVRSGETADAGRIVLGSERGALGPGGNGFLGGSVTDETGAPLENAVVRVHLEPETPGGEVVSTRTDAEGRFWISGLDRGIPVLVSASREGHVPVYYPGAHFWQEGERVEAGDSSDRVSPLAFRLVRNADAGPAYLGGKVETVPGGPGTLEATVVSSTRPLPLEGAFLYLEDPSTGAPVAGARTSENGTVFVAGLPRGEFVLRAESPGYAPLPSAGTHRVLLEPEPGTVAAVHLYPRTPGPETAAPTPEPNLLSQVGNAPNPFRPSTRIRYRLERSARVTLKVFDYRGRLVRTLLREEDQNPGPQQVSWDARGEDGQRVSSGVYFFRILAGSTSLSRKMVVLP